MNESNDLKRIQEFVTRLKSTNSTNDKIDIIKEYNDDYIIKQVLKYTYSPLKKFHLTSTTVKKNKKFDMSLSLAAKQRSIHNNYSTFLVLFIMLSGHYSFLVYHKYNWLILCLIGIISAIGRHYFNLRGRNINRPSILFTSIIALIILASIIFIFKN